MTDNYDELRNTINKAYQEVLKGFSDNEFMKDIFSKEKEKKPRTKEEIRLEAIIKTLDEGPKSNNLNFTKEKIAQYKEEIMNSGNSDLLSAYAKANLYVEDLNESFEAYNKIANLKPEENIVVGLLYYNKGNDFLAERFLEKTDQNLVVPTVALTFIYAKKGKPNQKEKLSDYVDKSYQANVLLGVLEFNEGNFGYAEKYFNKAQKMSPKQETMFKIARTKYAKGQFEDAFITISEMFNEYEVDLNGYDLQKELQEQKMSIPDFKISGKMLYRIIS